jgi:hypothetical protein
VRPETRLARFWSKVDRDGSGGCWLWTGSHKSSGYGQFLRNRPAHRWLWEHERGPVPPGQELDHLCRVRRCVNLAHLELVTRRENLLRGDTIPAAHARKTHCPVGHPYDYQWRSSRKCRTCRRLQFRAWTARRIASASDRC